MDQKQSDGVAIFPYNTYIYIYNVYNMKQWYFMNKNTQNGKIFIYEHEN